MKVIVTGRNMKVSEPLRDAVESKLEKFDTYFRSDIEAHVTFSHQKSNQIVEITIPLKNGKLFRVEETTEDMYVSIDNAIEKLKKQIRKHKTKIEKRFHAHESIKFESIPLHEETEPESKIVRTKKFAVKPMDPEEAVLQMEMLGHDFFVFLNGETEEVNVVYMRKDGDYGLIEPYL